MVTIIAITAAIQSYPLKKEAPNRRRIIQIDKTAINRAIIKSLGAIIVYADVVRSFSSSCSLFLNSIVAPLKLIYIILALLLVSGNHRFL